MVSGMLNVYCPCTYNHLYTCIHVYTCMCGICFSALFACVLSYLQYCCHCSFLYCCLWFPATVISSLGSAATGQFGSLGVSWNSGAPPLATSSPPPPAPSQYPVPGDQETTLAPRRLERNQTPDDDLGLCKCGDFTCTCTCATLHWAVGDFCHTFIIYAFFISV